MAKKKVVTKKAPAKKKAPKVKLKEYFFVVLSWSNGKGSAGVLSDIHAQDKGATFDIFGVQEHASRYLSSLAGPGVVAVLTNFFSITKSESELYNTKFQSFKVAETARRKEEFDRIAQEAIARDAEETESHLLSEGEGKSYPPLQEAPQEESQAKVAEQF